MGRSGDYAAHIWPRGNWSRNEQLLAGDGKEVRAKRTKRTLVYNYLVGPNKI